MLHIGRDNPRVNYIIIINIILNLGACSLHPVHTAFKKGLSELLILKVFQSYLPSGYQV